MARAQKEKSEKLNSVEETRLWARTILSELAKLGDVNHLEKENPEALELVQTALRSVKQEAEDQNLYKAAEGLFAVALANLDKLEDEVYKTDLISNWIPTDQELLLRHLETVRVKYKIGNKTIETLISAIETPKKRKPEVILRSLKTIVNKLKRQPDRDTFRSVLDFVVYVWPDLTLEQRQEFETVFTELSISLAKHDPVGTAELYILWQEKLFQISTESDISRPELGLIHSTTFEEPKYSEILLSLLPHRAFDELGYALKSGARDQAITIEDLIKQFDNTTTTLKQIKPFMRERMVNVYVEMGFVRKLNSGKIKLTAKGKQQVNLGYNELETIQLATKILGERKGKVKGGISSMTDITAAYEDYHQSISIPELVIYTDDDHRRILYLADLLFGQKDLSTKVLNLVIEQIRLQPKSQRPHYAIISGLVAGAFQYRLKDRRAALALASMDDQFAAAKVFIDQLLAMGIKIAYVLSDEDREQARNYTLMALKAIEYAGNPQSDSAKKHISYGEEARMRQPGKRPGQADLWDIHYDFQINVVFPYYYRTGRRLRSADEIYAARIVREEYLDLSPEELRKTPGVYVRQEEYIILYDAYQRLCRGEKLPKHYGKILDIDKIPVPGKEFTNFGIYNGLKLVTKTTGQEYTSLLHHNGLGLSPTGLKRDPLSKIFAQLGDMDAAGLETPDEVVVMHQQQGMGQGKVVSLPGFGGVNIFQRSQSFFVSGESALRQIGRDTGVPNPGGIERTVYDDGRIVTKFFTEYQMRTAHLGKRTAWLPFSDTHVGNVAAALDLYLRYQDYALKDFASQYDRIVLVYLGDGINALNVETAAQDNALTGLTSLEHMEAMYHRLIEEGLTQGNNYDDLPQFIDKIDYAYSFTGNHELNTGRRKGVLHSYSLGTTELLKRILGRDKASYMSTIKGPDGQLIVFPGGITQTHGGTKALGSHKLLWARFGGGNGILNGQKIVHGLSRVLTPDVNMLIMGDQHVGKWGFAAGKVVLVVPSTCFTTGFEFGLGLWTLPGGMFYVSGGGYAPELHEIPLSVIANHQITSGSLSEEAVASINSRLVTDRDYRPGDGLYTGPYQPHDYLQHWVLYQTNNIVGGNQSH